MASFSWKSRFIHYFLVSLIICFFAIPLLAFYLFDVRIYPAKRMASLLLIFFR